MARCKKFLAVNLETLAETVDKSLKPDMTSVHRSDKKLPVHWSSRIPKRYKRNAVNANLHRAKNISFDLNDEIRTIKEKFTKAGFPVKFTDSVIRQFNDKFSDNKDDDEPLIPPYFLEEPKKFISIVLPYCERNESVSKNFIEQFHIFTDNKYQLNIKWKYQEGSITI